MVWRTDNLKVFTTSGCQKPWVSTTMGPWLWRKMQGALQMVDPWGSAPEVWSPGAGGLNLPRPKEGLPVGRSLDLYVFQEWSRAWVSASEGWASVRVEQLILAWAHHGGCTTVRPEHLVLRPSHLSPWRRHSRLDT